MNITVKSSQIFITCQQNTIVRFPRIYLSTQEHVIKKKWKPTIGLEIHAQIATNSKLFSPASTKFQKPVNSCVSFFDCATPGTMPVLNKKCVEAGVTTALALSCTLNEISIFERKHYFYPDLPAGYQITQCKQPLASNGELHFLVENPKVCKEPYEKVSKIKQIQLEQDSGRSFHDESAGRNLIDLNRAGVPLMELVFEPDLNDEEEAAAAVKELVNIFRILGTCSCKMEEGAFRIDANVSVSSDDNLGVRTELKNIAHVRAVASAIKYEINRQILLLQYGKSVINETRAWDSVNKKTVTLREKEEKQDYRFMPETDLLPLRICLENTNNKYNLVDVATLKKQLPELPLEKRKRLKEKYGLKDRLILQLCNELDYLELFFNVIEGNKNLDPNIAANFIINTLQLFLNSNEINFDYCQDKIEYISELIDLMQSDQINVATAIKILKYLNVKSDKSPSQLAKENNWILINDEKELEIICKKVIEENPKIAKKYAVGKKKKEFRTLLGKVAQSTNERANMKKVSSILNRLIEKFF
ncbi:PREDICTED: glutamyl-tRNA(Gln) amidotransferase subunit B, mitochondrial [Polistes canadensis]|uniref:glutamyl-tRNA(Gln) amidotransferase subunit B, mitochondrial n=1 Tax=Polistes canadensis TaxID=91411 RepID=UPI000718FE62|nr:PREDICTED: glutamyl-tRNA(Gln) amidotransferase subunit B, mitochondrial [Polistes canadensis]